MFLLVTSLFVLATALKIHIRFKTERIKCCWMKCIDLFFNILKCNISCTAYSVSKVFPDNILWNTNGFKNLWTLVWLNCRNTHFWCNLDNSVKDRCVIIINRCIIIFVKKILPDKLFYSAVGKIRIYRTGTISQYCSKVMYFSWLCWFKYHCNTCSLLCSYKMLLHWSYRKKWRYSHMILINSPVSKDKNVCTLLVSSVSFKTHTVKCFLKWCILIISNRNINALKSLFIHIFNLHKVSVSKDRIADFKHLAVVSLFFKQISVLTDINACRCYDFLSYRINRRVCNLCKKLFKIVEQWLRLIWKHWKRCISTHWSNRLCTFLCHRKNRLLVILISITECLLKSCSLLVSKLHYFLIRNTKFL